MVILNKFLLLVFCLFLVACEDTVESLGLASLSSEGCITEYSADFNNAGNLSLDGGETCEGSLSFNDGCTLFFTYGSPVGNEILIKIESRTGYANFIGKTCDEELLPSLTNRIGSVDENFTDGKEYILGFAYDDESGTLNLNIEANQHTFTIDYDIPFGRELPY